MKYASPELAYALCDNIRFPGTAAQATAAEAIADARGDALLPPANITFTVGAGAIKLPNTNP